MQTNTNTTHTPIVSGTQTCLRVDGHALFYTGSGVPVELVLEQAGIMLNCIETLVLSRDSLEEHVHTTTLQYLTDLVRALVNASYDGVCAYEEKNLAK